MSYLAYLEELNNFKHEFKDNDFVLNKINLAINAINAYSKQQIPNKLENFSFDTNYIFENLNTYPNLLALDDLLAEFRQVCIENFGIWHLFDQLWLNDFEKFLNKQSCLEIMSGNALISSKIKNIFPSDNFVWNGQDIEKPNPWCFVEKADAFSKVKELYNTVNNILLTWCPETTNVDYQILSFLRNHHWQGNFIVIADASQKSTNSKEFWQHANLSKPQLLNQHHIQIDYIDDQVFLVK